MTQTKFLALMRQLTVMCLVSKVPSPFSPQAHAAKQPCIFERNELRPVKLNVGFSWVFGGTSHFSKTFEWRLHFLSITLDLTKISVWDLVTNHLSKNKK